MKPIYGNGIPVLGVYYLTGDVTRVSNEQLWNKADRARIAIAPASLPGLDQI
jgi:hypothetical protein